MKKVYKGYVFGGQKIKDIFPVWYDFKGQGGRGELDANPDCKGVFKEDRKYTKMKQVEITVDIKWMESK